MIGESNEVNFNSTYLFVFMPYFYFNNFTDIDWIDMSERNDKIEGIFVNLAQNPERYIY